MSERYWEFEIPPCHWSSVIRQGVLRLGDLRRRGLLLCLLPRIQAYVDVKLWSLKIQRFKLRIYDMKYS